MAIFHPPDSRKSAGGVECACIKLASIRLWLHVNQPAPSQLHLFRGTSAQMQQLWPGTADLRNLALFRAGLDRLVYWAIIPHLT